MRELRERQRTLLTLDHTRVFKGNPAVHYSFKRETQPFLSPYSVAQEKVCDWILVISQCSVSSNNSKQKKITKNTDNGTSRIPCLISKKTEKCWFETGSATTKTLEY